jgi:hypothetical protein
MDLIEHFWDLTTVSDANNKSYQIWYIPRVIISRISFSKRSSLQYVINAKSGHTRYWIVVYSFSLDFETVILYLFPLSGITSKPVLSECESLSIL